MIDQEASSAAAESRATSSVVPAGTPDDSVRALQHALYRAAKADPGRRFHALHDKVFRRDVLWRAWVIVRRNNGAPGIDATTLADVEEYGVSRLLDELAADLREGRWRPVPARRVFIPKPGSGEKRPLSIPTVADRIVQAATKIVLEPVFEADFAGCSFGFRPKRAAHDALQVLIDESWRGRRWVVETDIANCFEAIPFETLMQAVQERVCDQGVLRLLRAMLRAGVMHENTVRRPVSGTPQGGVVSPLLLNIALHGMERAAGVTYARCDPKGAYARTGSPVLVRYADDFVVMCHSRDEAESARSRLEEWLSPRGLAINEDKTRVVHLTDGFDFLGFNVRRYPSRNGGKLLIKPSGTAVTRIRQRLTNELRFLRGANALTVIRRLNPIIRGWAAYYRGVVSKEVFAEIDHHLWQNTYRWALRAHPNKSKKWVLTRYFDAFNPSRTDRWVFGDRDSGLFMRRFVWTKIVRHAMVAGNSSPDDPALADYWQARRRTGTAELGRTLLILARRQDGRCPDCGDHLVPVDLPQSPHQWEQWIVSTRTALRIIGGPKKKRPADQAPDRSTQLVHTHCHNRAPTGAGNGTPTADLTPKGLA